MEYQENPWIVPILVALGVTGAGYFLFKDRIDAALEGLGEGAKQAAILAGFGVSVWALTNALEGAGD